jgi:dCMP deaminase
VLHAGYLALLDKHRDASVLVLGASFADEFPVLRKEIRALAPADAARLVGGMVVETDGLGTAVTGDELVVPDEELMRDLVARHDLGRARIITWERTFLRWDRSWSLAARPAEYDGVVAADELTRAMLHRATEQARYSSDWWRQVGAVAARDGRILAVAHNEHRPTEYTPYVNGDPRNDFSRGVHSELSTALHAEAAIVARAARTGQALVGADLYVSTFPCPACARLIAEAGFRRVYFAGPYAVLDGDEILRTAGVERVWVPLEEAH